MALILKPCMVCKKDFLAKRTTIKCCSKGCKDFAKGMKIDLTPKE